MGQFSRVGSIVLATALITTALSAPIYAAIRQPFHPLLTEAQRTYLALSWGDIWNVLRGKRKSGGSRGGAICEIAPVKLVDRNAKEETQDIQEVWSESPLFLWTIKGGTAQKIQLFVYRNEELLWSPEIKAGETKVVYDGKPLQPGQIYEWQLSALAPVPTKSSGVRFKFMDSQKRDRITAELRQLEERLEGASAETMALEKANYFAERGLWSDALRELYSVPKPSVELRDAIALLQAHNFCAEDKPNGSASR
jgi:hypothetical protein